MAVSKSDTENTESSASQPPESYI